MALVKHGNYNMHKDLDADLQESPQPSDMVLKLQGVAMFEAARRKAIQMLNSNLKNHIAEVTFEQKDFMPSQMGLDKSTGKQSVCEWKAQKSKGEGQNAITIFAMLDIDDIPPGAAQNGPDRPHVGFSFWGTAANPQKHIKRHNGHVFVNYVHVSRNA